MSRILLLSYYFPPIGGAGAQRPAKFARYLHDLGHDVVVLTGSGRTGHDVDARRSHARARRPGRGRVVRVPGPEPAPS